MGLGPQSESLRKALQWLGEERLLKPAEPLRALYEAACLGFDLSPADCETLYKLCFGKLQKG